MFLSPPPLFFFSHRGIFQVYLLFIPTEIVETKVYFYNKYLKHQTSMQLKNYRERNSKCDQVSLMELGVVKPDRLKMMRMRLMRGTM